MTVSMLSKKSGYMSLLRKDHVGLPARQRFGAGGKPIVYRTLYPTLPARHILKLVKKAGGKDGVIAEIIRDTINYLPRPLGRGLWINQRNWGFNPFLELTQC